MSQHCAGCENESVVDECPGIDVNTAIAQATTDHQRIIAELQAQVASLTQQLDYQIESVRPALIAQARREEREAICSLLETYAVNVGGPCHVKPLIDDHGRGKEDVVRQAYIAAIRARGER